MTLLVSTSFWYRMSRWKTHDCLNPVNNLIPFPYGVGEVIPNLSKAFPRLIGIKYFSFFVELIFVSYHLFNFFNYPWFVALPNNNSFYRHIFFCRIV